ncbi:hypothetical protein AGMMS49992_01620 [Clostridia bacterium]|nr:hypothetical protein AGMMS49992_01620 [Clostridia bacterium]
MFSTKKMYDNVRPRRSRAYMILGIISALLLVAIIAVLLNLQPASVTIIAAPDGERLYEGGRDVDAVALAGVTVEPTASGLTLTLAFTGWTAQGESVPIQSNPQLTITRYHNPERLAVAVPDLADWSAITDMNLPNSLIEGVFCVDRTLYWQLTGPVDVSLEGRGGSLRLTLERASRPTTAGWSVLADACNRVEYVPLLGSMLQMGFSPVRCADGGTVIMQSKRFSKKADAEALERSARAVCQSAGTPASIRVEYFDGSRLPLANPPADTARLERAFHGARAALIMRDARILARASDVPVMLVERADGALFTLNASGARTALPVQHIPKVSRAALSPTAQFAALSTELGDLDIIDVKTGRSHVLNDTTPSETELRAATTDTFAWFDETMLAVMMGDPLRFLAIDAALPDDEPSAIRAIDPYGGVEGVMMGRNDELFLLDNKQMLYRFTPSDASRVTIGLADRFAVSPDASKAVLISGDEDGATLIYWDLDTWRQTLIGVGMPAVEACVNDDGSVYIIMKELGQILRGTPVFRLYRYNIADNLLTAVAQIPETKLYPADTPGALIVNCLDEDGVWSVYRLEV